jgi:murein DD-endopeptidase MepM/ murein hydrolase activator NlpD
MADWSYELARHREQKIRTLQRKLEMDGRMPTWEAEHVGENVTWGGAQKPARRSIHVFLVQLVIAAMLFLCTLIGVRYPVAEQWITTAWEQKIPYEQLTTYYQQFVGSRPTLLPTFMPEKPAETWIAPVKGKVVLPFTAQRKGVVIQTEGAVPIVATKSGKITFIGQKTGIGKTMIISHEDGKETWIGFLGEVEGSVGTTVKQGTEIGKVTPRNQQYFVYLALKNQGQFINPVGSISFH